MAKHEHGSTDDGHASTGCKNEEDTPAKFTTTSCSHKTGNIECLRRRSFESSYRVFLG